MLEKICLHMYHRKYCVATACVTCVIFNPKIQTGNDDRHTVTMHINLRENFTLN